MGLDTTHDCWHGPYSSFGEWRVALAEAAGFPSLRSMVGFGGTIPWTAFQDDPLTALLCHSDCDGDLAPEVCGPIADRLEEILPRLSGDDTYYWSDRGRAMKFIEGLRLAASRGERVEFH